MVLCDSIYPRKLAFHYLQDLHKEFNKFDVGMTAKITRPYSFIRFGSSCYYASNTYDNAVDMKLFRRKSRYSL